MVWLCQRGILADKGNLNENTYAFQILVTGYIHFVETMRTSSRHVISLMFS